MFADVKLHFPGNKSLEGFILFYFLSYFRRRYIESIEKELKKVRVFPLSVEGKKDSEWILLDYGSFVVHIFSEKARDYYSLDKLWADAPRLTY